MRLRPLLTLALGVVIAGSAVVYTHAFMKAESVGQDVQDVVVVTDDIPFGHTIGSDVLAVRSWPSDAIPEGAFLSIADVIGNGETQPRRAKYTIASGDVLIDGKVSDFGEQVTITQQIDPEMRAVTIRVNDVTGVAGFVAPSDRIDLTLTRTVDQGLTTSTILQDVEVLGIDQSGSHLNKPTKIETVTVQVKPADAQKLALAQQAGTLSLSLRHIDAADQPTLESISVGDLTERAAPLPKKKRIGLPSIVVNRGGQRTTIEVPSG